MKRRYLAQALLVASFGALTATGYAQTPAPTDQTPNSPGAAAPAAGTGNATGQATTGTTPATTTYGATAGTPAMRAPMTSAEIRAYEKARGECEAGPGAQRVPCWTTLRGQYRGVSPKCEALTGNALDACIHQDSTADNAGK
ncbi:MAG TPA: hypothetical protein VGK37_12430 [Casimicrobiaceae bacterium]|jgi:hypothetical protein